MHLTELEQPLEINRMELRKEAINLKEKQQSESSKRRRVLVVNETIETDLGEYSDSDSEDAVITGFYRSSDDLSRSYSANPVTTGNYDGCNWPIEEKTFQSIENLHREKQADQDEKNFRFLDKYPKIARKSSDPLNPSLIEEPCINYANSKISNYGLEHDSIRKRSRFGENQTTKKVQTGVVKPNNTETSQSDTASIKEMTVEEKSMVSSGTKNEDSLSVSRQSNGGKVSVCVERTFIQIPRFKNVTSTNSVDAFIHTTPKKRENLVNKESRNEIVDHSDRYRKIVPKPVDQSIIQAPCFTPWLHRFRNALSRKQQRLKNKITRNNRNKALNPDNGETFRADIDLVMEVIDESKEIESNNEHIIPESSIKLCECAYCTFKHPKETNLLKHILVHHVFNTCPHCKLMVFYSTKQLLTHYETCLSFNREESKNGYKCALCSTYLKKQELLRGHIMSHRILCASKCIMCDYESDKRQSISKRIESLKDHVLQSHNGLKLQKYLCPICEFTSILNSEMKIHIYLSHSESKGNFFNCLECTIIVDSLTKLLDHVSLHNKERIFSCSECKFSIHNELWITLHERTHKRNVFKCPYCTKSSREHFYIKYHILRHHTRNFIKLKAKS